MEDCIFCKIARKDKLSDIIMETENCMALLDINPVNPGHLLIISKEHFKSVAYVPDEILSEMILLAKRVGNAARKTLGATGYNILNATGSDAQQSIYHIHFHVVPRYPHDKLDLWFYGESQLNKDVSGLLEQFKEACADDI